MKFILLGLICAIPGCFAATKNNGHIYTPKVVNASTQSTQSTKTFSTVCTNNHGQIQQDTDTFRGPRSTSGCNQAKTSPTKRIKRKRSRSKHAKSKQFKNRPAKRRRFWGNLPSFDIQFEHVPSTNKDLFGYVIFSVFSLLIIHIISKKIENSRPPPTKDKPTITNMDPTEMTGYFIPLDFSDNWDTCLPNDNEELDETVHSVANKRRRIKKNIPKRVVLSELKANELTKASHLKIKNPRDQNKLSVTGEPMLKEVNNSIESMFYRRPDVASPH